VTARIADGNIIKLYYRPTWPWTPVFTSGQVSRDNESHQQLRVWSLRDFGFSQRRWQDIKSQNTWTTRADLVIGRMSRLTLKDLWCNFTVPNAHSTLRIGVMRQKGQVLWGTRAYKRSFRWVTYENPIRRIIQSRSYKLVFSKSIIRKQSLQWPSKDCFID
jgi:hypothetical protein